MHQIIPLKKQRRTKEYFGYALARNSDNGMNYDTFFTSLEVSEALHYNCRGLLAK